MSIYRQKINDDEVDEIFQTVPREFFKYASLMILITIIILGLLATIFTYEESEQFKIEVLSNSEKENQIITKIPQNQYSKIKNSSDFFISFDLYPKEKFGFLLGRLSKNNIQIDKNGFINVNINLSDTLTNKGNIIELKKGMTGTAKIIHSEKMIIEKIFE